MNPNFKKKKPLPYKNLGELYTEAVEGEPSINRLPIVETGSVLITRDNGAEDVLRQNVSDDDLNRIDVILNERELISVIDNAIEARKVELKSRDLSGLITLSLREAIKTSGSVQEIKVFCKAYREGVEFINIKELTTHTSNPQEINTFITDPFAQNVFRYLFINLPAGKGDAGPGEGALVALSPNISYANKGDVSINNNKVEVKAARNSEGNGGRVWDGIVNQSGMVEALQSIFKTPQIQWSVRVKPSHTKTKNFVNEIINNDQEKKFIKAACDAWFGTLIQEVIDSFGKQEFAAVWHKHIFNTYKDKKQFVGLLALGSTEYHYVTTDEDFVKMNFSDAGYICSTSSTQGRDLAPQLQIS